MIRNKAINKNKSYNHKSYNHVLSINFNINLLSIYYIHISLSQIIDKQFSQINKKKPSNFKLTLENGVNGTCNGCGES